MQTVASVELEQPVHGSGHRQADVNVNVAVVTASIPWGNREQFIFAELDALEEQGYRVTIIPVKPSLRSETVDGRAYRSRALAWPLFAGRYLRSVGYWTLRRPGATIRCILTVLLQSGDTRKTAKNLAVLPKSFHVARWLERSHVQHIHAHWLSTSATVAMIASMLTGIPWSVTAHRWDIADGNLLPQKAASATVLRVISRDGERELKGYLDDRQLWSKVTTIHMGVNVPSEDQLRVKPVRQQPVLVMPANLVEKKGHAVLLDALAEISRRENVSFQCLVVGDGPLDAQIRDRIHELGLEEWVVMLGKLPHDDLLRRYYAGEIDIVVLPSIVTDGGEREGIPVSLMEAMAAGIAVVATKTGGTEELVEGAGVLIPERDTGALIAALTRLLMDPVERERLARSGRERIVASFSAESQMRQLSSHWRAGPMCKVTPGPMDR